MSGNVFLRHTAASGVEYVAQIARASEEGLVLFNVFSPFALVLRPQEVISANRTSNALGHSPLNIWCTDVRHSRVMLLF